MNFLSKWFNKPQETVVMQETIAEEKAVGDGIMHILLGPAGALWGGQSYYANANEGYRTNPYVFTAIKYIATNLASVPLKLLSSTNQFREFQVVETHPLLNLLMQPNFEQGKSEFFRELTSYVYINGAAYIYLNGPDNFRYPIELINLRPDLVKPIQGGFEYRANNANPIIYPADRIVYIKEFDPLGGNGMSPIQAAGKSALLVNASKDWNKSLLDNGASPTGILKSKTKVSESTKDRLKEQFKTEHAGSKNAGKILALTEGDLEYQQISFSPAEMAWDKLNNLSAREISVVMGVPPQIMGLPDSQTYSNYEEARKSFYVDTVIPLAQFMLDKFNNQITPMFGDNLKIVIDADQIPELSEDKTVVYQRLEGAVNAGIMSIEEARERIGLDRNIPSGDTFLGAKQPTQPQDNTGE